MEDMRLPTLSHFTNGNGWIGSLGRLRYEIETPREVEEKGPLAVTVVLWEGPFSRPYARETGRRDFPVTEDGLAALREFLTQSAREAQDHPSYTDREAMDYYLAQKAREAP